MGRVGTPRPPAGTRSVRRALAALALLAFFWGPAGLAAQTLDEALRLLASGEYTSAVNRLQNLARDRSAPVDVFRALAEGLAAVGRYQEATRTLERAPAVFGDELANTLGEVLYATGELEGARASFQRGVDAGAPDHNVARLNLAVLEYQYGDRERAMELFDAFIDLYNGSQELAAPDLLAVARAVRYLSATNADLLHDALRAADEAIAADPSLLEARVLTGELFLRTYQGIDADQAFDEVLQRNPRQAEALLGKARAAQFNLQADAMERVHAALEVNPDLVPALVFKAELYLEVENHEQAREELDKALEVNPRSLEALSVLAASHYLRDEVDEYARLRDRVLELSPHYPDLFNTVAEMAVQNRKYREAADLAREAIRVDERSWTAWGLLGMNQLRLGEVEEGVANLEAAFEGDSFNPWFKNTLDLTDTFERYQVFESERFRILLHEREASLLEPYVEEIANEAFDALRERYHGYTPPLPIRIEVFPSHADFSVRTVGLAGIGALGVSFGSVIAMDSPSAKPLGEFNWASALWHEMAHVFHLGMTDHEVPRWFSEGLAVHEQHKARPGWGHQASPDFLMAYKQGLTLPVSQLNEGFVRPKYPAQVVHSYYQASLVFEFIEGRWGARAILDMLNGYRDGLTTPELVERVLGMDPEDLDEAFVDYFESRFEQPLAALDALPEDMVPAMDQASGADSDTRGRVRLARENPNNFIARLRAGVALFDEGRYDEAELHLRASVRLFPEYGGPDSGYWYLSRIHEQRGELEQAAAALRRLNALNESDYRARVALAGILERLGEEEDAADALDAAVTIYPYEIDLHEKLARARARQGRSKVAVRERRAVVALEPADRAEALYQLALAYRADGDVRAARRTVLEALEIAPSYEAALELLLELRAGTGGGPSSEGPGATGAGVGGGLSRSPAVAGSTR